MKFGAIFSSVAAFSLFVVMSFPALAGSSYYSQILAVQSSATGAAASVKSLPTTLANQVQKQVQTTALNGVNNLLNLNGLSASVPKISAQQLFSSCTSKYVNETGMSACGQVDLGDLSGQLSKISQQTIQQSLANAQKAATSYLATKTTSYVQSTTAGVKSSANSYLASY